jgi:hypothetical protein
VMEKSTRAKAPNNKIRFSFYRMFTYKKFVHFGRGNQIKIPDRLEQQVKHMSPNLDGNYTYFSRETEL